MYDQWVWSIVPQFHNNLLNYVAWIPILHNYRKIYINRHNTNIMVNNAEYIHIISYCWIDARYWISVEQITIQISMRVQGRNILKMHKDNVDINKVFLTIKKISMYIIYRGCQTYKNIFKIRATKSISWRPFQVSARTLLCLSVVAPYNVLYI